MRSELDYTGWRENVDRYVWQIAGLSIDDLPDVPLRQWYDDGVSPQAAAKRAVRYAMEGLGRVSCAEDETKEYRIEYTDGTAAVTVDTYGEAVDLVRDQWPEAEIGHDGDIGNGGDRTLAWPDEESSIDDGGQNACAEIVQVCSVCGRPCDANPCRHGRD